MRKIPKTIAIDWGGEYPGKDAKCVALRGGLAITKTPFSRDYTITHVKTGKRISTKYSDGKLKTCKTFLHWLLSKQSNWNKVSENNREWKRLLKLIRAYIPASARRKRK